MFDFEGLRGKWVMNLDDKTYKEYTEFVQKCHWEVEKYLSRYPEIKYNTDGFRYFDILKMASPELDKKATEWSKLLQRINNEHRSGMFNYMQSICSSKIDKNDPFVKTMIS